MILNTKTFNNHYIKTVEINCGLKRLEITNQSKDDFSVTDKIHPNVKQISIAITTSNTPKAIPFSFELTNTVEVQRRLKNINTKKASGFDKIRSKLVKLSAEILSTPMRFLS